MAGGVPLQVQMSCALALRSGARDFDKAMEAREGSARRRRLLDRAAATVREATELAAKHGVHPDDFPEWAHQRAYGPEKMKLAREAASQLTAEEG